jgi:ethanolamine-phosphate cytidylyltransferase
MLQARQLGTQLVVGVHSDEAILENKGPTVMNLEERTAAVDACRWVTESVTRAPYVTSLPWISHYGCKYVVHGDDITSDSTGEDCYRFVKAAGRFKVVKRTPSISTTDLVGRMLLCTRTHFIKSLQDVLEGKEGSGSEDERKGLGETMAERIRSYATNETGLNPGVDVYLWTASAIAKEGNSEETEGQFTSLVSGTKPKPGQRVVYVDGGFDLFSSGHIEFLRQVILTEEKQARADGWYGEDAVAERRSKGDDYGPVYVVAGVHDDETINRWKGVNYPIMNIFERGLCVLQCKYINAIVFNAPFTPTKSYLTGLPWDTPRAVYHGPTSFMPLTYDPYTAAKEMGIFYEVQKHSYDHVNAEEIVERIMRSRARYEARQRAKGEKAFIEAAAKAKEEQEKANSA